MKKGDLVRVTWPDGLEMIATYVGEERGFAILKTKDNKRQPAKLSSVKFEVISESG
tara:strand:- start:231 stop:398 length:168 start_codon:yes stop_codon:yes gene_type:complete